MVNFRFDHAIIAVNDLDTAIADYRALGFNAVYGGEHASGTTHNGLIVFRDGSYLELIATTGRPADPDNPSTDFSALLAGGEGLVGYAIGADDLDAAASGMRGRGLDVSQPQEGNRKRPDGVELAWKTVGINGSMSPFFIEDITDRVLRVSDDRAITTHENGATGTSAVTFNFADVDAKAAAYTAMLGLSAEKSDHGLSIDLGSTRLLLNPEGEAGVHHGTDAPYRLLIATTKTEKTGLIRMDRAHGARLLLVDAGH